MKIYDKLKWLTLFLFFESNCRKVTEAMEISVMEFEKLMFFLQKYINEF